MPTIYDVLGCGGNDLLENIGTSASMIENGWRLNFTYDGIIRNENYKFVESKCVGAKWHGWSDWYDAGTLSAELNGFGEITLGFGNCWDDGNVNVYLDGILKSTAPAGITRKVTKITFDPGSLLTIKDEDGNSVVMLNSVRFSCPGMLKRTKRIKLLNTFCNQCM